MLSWKVALRFLRSAPTQSVLIISGIAVGIAVQIFVGSLITSLQANLIDTTVGSSPQVTITDRTEGDPVVYTDRMQQVVTSDPRVKPGAVRVGIVIRKDDPFPLGLRLEILLKPTSSILVTSRIDKISDDFILGTVK